MASYESLQQLKNQLIRKSNSGSAFIAETSVAAIANLTTYTAQVTGPPLIPAKIDLTTLPNGYEDLGYLTDDGLGFENETSQSDVTSWQSLTPTRSDLLTDTDTMAVVAQETKLLTLGLYTGVDTSALKGAVNTGEVSISKPERPSARFYRVLGLAVDGEIGNEIYIARFMPRAKVTGKVGQKWGKGDDPISWGLTFTAFKDSTLGYATRYIFGGPGWYALLADMGITEAA